MENMLSHQYGGRFDDMDGFSQGGGHGGELIPDLFGGHVLQERTYWWILFDGVVQIWTKTQCARCMIDAHL